MTKTARSVWILCLPLLVAAAAKAAATDLWLHVRVHEGGGAKVSVNLPISLVETVLPVLSQGHFQHGYRHVEHAGLSVAEMRRIWQELKGGPDATFVTIDEGDDRVRVSKQAGLLVVQVREGDGEETVDVRIPAAVVDALLSGEADELNVEAGVEALVAHGEGELVNITDREDRVRVWIDRLAESE